MTTHTATVYADEQGEWRWRVRAANQEIVSEGESYKRREDARRGLRTAHPEFAGSDFTENAEGGESASVEVE